MDDHYQTPLISRAIRNVARNRNLSTGAIFHSDRGSNYMSAEFGKTLDRLRLRRVFKVEAAQEHLPQPGLHARMTRPRVKTTTTTVPGHCRSASGPRRGESKCLPTPADHRRSPATMSRRRYRTGRPPAPARVPLTGMYGAVISHSVSEVSDGWRRGRFTATHPPTRHR
ncbi:hypothetical protein [Streptomyces sp. Y7]|uniref:hypothetical protein n=1 Tax=Streptomyces sp. Y7 TaxID=3342392 RepID=UPI00372144D2